MKSTNNLPRFVILQHTLPDHREGLRQRMNEHRPLTALNPLSWPGEIGTYQGIEIALFAGGEPERVIVPILERPEVEYIFCLGLAGSLSAELHLGDIVAPTASVRGDGLTDYWADPKLPAVAHMAPLSALNQAAQQLDIPITNGIFYTSATWYKEPDFIEKWSELGVIGIQMELAQYYLLSHLYGKKTAALYIISDLPLEGEAVWQTGFRQDKTILAGCLRSVEILLDAIELLAGTIRTGTVADDQHE
jgi:purine-nucleoside phosphorylase